MTPIQFTKRHHPSNTTSPRGQGKVYAREYKGADPAFVLMHGFPG